MKLSRHAVPFDAAFAGEVSPETFWYVRTEQLTKSRYMLKKEAALEKYGSLEKPIKKPMLRKNSTPGVNYSYKQRTCRNKGCHKVLKADQVVACSVKCKGDIVSTCMTLLSNLNVTSEDYDHFLEYGT